MTAPVPIADDAHWHALRAKTVGASEVAALFDASPYFTRFMLWNAKAGRVPLDNEGTDRTEWGQILQPAIAAGVAKKHSWKLIEGRGYYQHPTIAGMGATLDYEVIDHEFGPGIVEIKNVDWLQWKQNWTEARAPIHIELQVQHQFAVTGYPWGAIAALVGGNDLKVYQRRPEPKAIEKVTAKVTEFWASIAAAKEPDPFGLPMEAETLKALFPAPDPAKSADLSDDIEAFEWCRELVWARDQARFHDKNADRLRVMLMHRMKDAGVAIVPGFRVSRGSKGSLLVKQLMPDDQLAALEPSIGLGANPLG